MDGMGELCSPFARSRCCDPEVHIYYIHKSLHLLHLTSQGKGKKYRLGEIYEDDSKCPPVDYKCKRIRGMRNLDWEQMGSGNFFEGMYIIFFKSHVFMCAMV